ncbi:hypothetical protein JR316_0011899 [Psilocybe cubensis]|uniref:Uncharacterized protein n=1 Tax=Psilocybe cubensis TaxID=181762 RepID=A0ACB8GLH9_PSICU|nr:hypothetical protein JR316_0011899 [Psilocybe cubensis]KAH9476324.1 hypothetical protein JR316_0011899 [Psilocybe cubensis]
MAFLRKKKQPETPTQSPTKVTLAPSTSPPPLFARFSTTAQNNNVKEASPRIVSSPMMLTSQRKDRDMPQRVTSAKGFGHSTTSLAASNRDPNLSHRKVQENNQSSVVPINGSVHDLGPTSSQQLAKAPTRPASKVIVDKPLPPPSSAIINEHRARSLDTVNRRASANRPPGPPPSFQYPQPHVVRPRASLDMQDLEAKPLPQPGSTQASYQSAQGQDPRGPPPSTYTFSPSATTRRNASISTTSSSIIPHAGPPITSMNHKMQPSSFSYGRQVPPTTDQKIGSQTLSPPLAKRAVLGEDFSQNRVNGMEGVPSKRMSGVGLPQGRPQDVQRTPMSDRGIDLPPEAALFQEYSDAISIPGTPYASNARQLPPGSLKTTEQVSSSSIPRSSVYMQSDSKPQPPIPRPIISKPQPPSPPLPPPPIPDMGVAYSYLDAEVLPSSYKDFSTPQLISVANGTPSMFNNYDSGEIKPRTHQQSNSRSVSPPLPPGAAQPANFQTSPSKHQHMGSVRVHPPGFYPPSQSQVPMTQPFNNTQVPVQQPTPVMLQKSPSVQTTSAPLRGKPRIFAAMEAQENGTSYSQDDHAPMAQQDMTQHALPQIPPQPEAFYRPPANQHTSPQHQNQPQLLPPVEFTSPQLQTTLLPNSYVNGVDPQSMPASITPPSPKAHDTNYISHQLDMESSQELDAPFITPKSTRSLSLPRQEEPRQQQLQSPQATPRAKKLSKTRHHVDNASISTFSNGSNGTLQSSPETARARKRSASKSRPNTPMTTSKLLSSVDPALQVEQTDVGDVGIPLDDDPFARVEGVKMLPNSTQAGGTKERNASRHRNKGSVSVKESSIMDSKGENAPQDSPPEMENHSSIPLTPVSPEDLRKAKKDKKSKKTTEAPPTVAETIAALESPPPEPVTMVQILSDPQLLSNILSYLSFYDWCILSSISKEIRILFVRTPTLRETILETFLRTVGYCRWTWDDKEPLSLSLQDLNDYMRGVSIPNHEYARIAAMHVHSLSIHPNHRDPSLIDTVHAMTACTRAYSRVLLRLRAQAEKEASILALSNPLPPPSATSSKSAAGGSRGHTSRVSSRAPSPTTSTYSHPTGGHHAPTYNAPSSSQTSLTFRSPLFRLRRAPLLRVFVPSPEGDWLSDKSVLECEAECKRAGIMHLLRLGDVVWDVAVGDEGNVGRLVWDGSYLIDLDYTYSPVGDLPKYLPTLAFPPSYFHRVIRTGPNITNPIIHIDISPWGEEIAMNLQLLQDRVRTETPPRGPNRYNKGAPFNGRIPIPDSNNLFVDSGWYGTIVVETEGTNEALADLQDRCGPGAFPPRPRGVTGQISQAQIENRKVFRILREKSRPGEIWIKAVGVKERLL